MIKKIIILYSLLLVCNTTFSQKVYITKTGYISFFSHTLVEDIKAHNNQVLSVFNKETGEISIQLLIRSFNFKKTLMKQHFNESYIESHIYPKATFKGEIVNFKDISTTSKQNIEIKGVLKIRDIEKEVRMNATINILKNELQISGSFKVEVADFDIKIPAIVKNNIAKVIKVSFDLNHKPYK